MACSDDDNDIDYLNELDIKVKHIDVLDDYRSEKKQILSIDSSQKYTFGDHVARLFLGAIKYDKIDECPKKMHSKLHVTQPITDQSTQYNNRQQNAKIQES